MKKLNDLSRPPIPLDPDGTLIAVIELSLSSWLVAGIVPGVERQPLKKLAVDESALLTLLHRWREEAAKAGHRIKRIAQGKLRFPRSIRLLTSFNRGPAGWSNSSSRTSRSECRQLGILRYRPSGVSSPRPCRAYLRDRRSTSNKSRRDKLRGPWLRRQN